MKPRTVEIFTEVIKCIQESIIWVIILKKNPEHILTATSIIW